MEDRRTNQCRLVMYVYHTLSFIYEVIRGESQHFAVNCNVCNMLQTDSYMPRYNNLFYFPLAIYRFSEHVIVPRILRSSRLRCMAPIGHVVSSHCDRVAVSINSEQKVDLSGWSSLRELFIPTPFFNNIILIIKLLNL